MQMWPLDSFTNLSNNVQSGLQKAINEGFGPVTSIANSIGSTIGAVTGGVSASKKLAEDQAAIDAKEDAKKKAAEEKKAETIAENEVQDASGANVNIAKPVTLESDPTAYVLNIVKIVFSYFFAFIFAMLIVNQLIFEPVAYRVIIFIFVMLIPFFFSSFALVPIAAYYIGLILWRLYLNSTPEHKGNKLSLLPKIYCMLPLTTVEGTTSFARFFKYPFYYPKTEREEKRLQREQGEYENGLKASFYKWDEIVKKYPEFNTKFNEVSKQFKELITTIHAPLREEAATIAVGAVPVALEAATSAEAPKPEVL
jgi:hypothetical protein